jgi:hypothetical protein
MALDSGRASRFRELHVVPQGAGANGKEPSVGSGAIVPVKIILPATQTVNAIEVMTAAGVLLFAINKNGQLVGVAGSAAGLGGLGVAHAIYDFAVDGGASCTPASNAVIPINAIIIGVTVNPVTAPLAVGSATLGIGTTAGSTTTSLLAATAKASLTIDALINGVPTIAVPVKMSAAGSISVLIATGPLTAGKVEIFVYYTVALNA